MSTIKKMKCNVYVAWKKGQEEKRINNRDDGILPDLWWDGEEIDSYTIAEVKRDCYDLNFCKISQSPSWVLNAMAKSRTNKFMKYLVEQ